MPVNLKGWLEGLRKQINEARSNQATAGSSTAQAWKAVKVSYTSPTAQLILNHALPVLAFHICTLPKYNIGQGYKNIFQGALTSRGITIFETPQVVSLNDDSDTITQSNHGIFAVTHCNADFTLPTFGGTDLLGSIDWGDGTTESFASTARHNV